MRSRYIIKPENEAKKKPVGGTRKNYFSATSEIRYRQQDGTKKTQDLTKPLKLFCKEAKFNDPRTVIFEAFNAEFSYAMVGAERTPRHYLLLDTDEKQVVGIASERTEIDVFRFHFKANYWADVNPADLAIISTWDAIAGEEDKHKGNIAKKKTPKTKSIKTAITDASTTQSAATSATTTPKSPTENKIKKIFKKLFTLDDDMKDYHRFYSRLGHGGRWFFHAFSRYRHGMTTKDFTQFPITKKFRPHYWYSHRSYVSPSKAYNSTDIREMLLFSQNEKFIDEKVLLTLRWILFPEEIMRAALQQHRHENCDLYWLYLNEKKNRQAEIKAIALGTPQFRERLAKNKKQFLLRAQEALQEYCAKIRVVPPDLKKKFNELCELSEQCEQNADTPLHAAVRAHSQDGESFRYDETLAVLTEHKLDFKNNALIPEAQQTPAELAVSLGQKHVAQYLVNHGAKKPNGFISIPKKPLLEPRAKEILQQMRAKISADNNTLDVLAMSLKTLREHTSLSQKMKKNTAILMFMIAMPHVKSYYQYARMHHILDHYLNRFIEQLRSDFEIVRFLKGDLYGTTSTSKTIRHMIYRRGQSLIKTDVIQDKEQVKATRKLMRRDFKHCFSFFGLFTKKVKIELSEEYLPKFSVPNV